MCVFNISSYPILLLCKWESRKPLVLNEEFFKESYGMDNISAK